MLSKKHSLPFTLAALTVLSTSAALAQSLPQWQMNQQGQIMQDIGAGLLTPQEAAGLQNKEGKIQAQEQQAALKNGGYLTPFQQSRIASELKGVQRSLRGDLNSNAGNPSLYNNGRISSYGNPLTNWLSGRNYIPAQTVSPMVAPSAVMPSPAFNPFRHHHGQMINGQWVRY